LIEKRKYIRGGWMASWMGKMGGNMDGWMEDGIDCYTSWSIDCLPLGVAWDGRHGYLMAHKCVGLFAEGGRRRKGAVVDDTRACCEE
jgi:hypothetical protein